MTVLATDEGNPQRQSQQTGTVRINVIRNLNCPVFRNLPANITIDQSTSLNSLVYNVSAYDNDPVVSYSYFIRYFLVLTEEYLDFLNYFCHVWISMDKLHFCFCRELSVSWPLISLEMTMHQCTSALTATVATYISKQVCSRMQELHTR